MVKLCACNGNRLSHRFLVNSSEASLIVAFKGPSLVELARGSRLVKANGILFTEHLYSVYEIIPRFPLLSHMDADPASSLRFPGCGFSRVSRHSVLVTRLALSRKRGTVAVLAYPYLLRAFP